MTSPAIEAHDPRSLAQYRAEVEEQLRDALRQHLKTARELAAWRRIIDELQGRLFDMGTTLESQAPLPTEVVLADYTGEAT